jgi:hypothetical protein
VTPSIPILLSLFVAHFDDLTKGQRWLEQIPGTGVALTLSIILENKSSLRKVSKRGVVKDTLC